MNADTPVGLAGNKVVRETRYTRSWVQLAALGAILLLAVVVRFWNLNELGYANHYYAAAVKSMLQSWHNFFFVAAEPGGAVSVDKPPLGLWIQTASAWVFGINTFGLLFPQILAGLLSCWVVYRLAARAFGAWAGLLAALVLALTPVTVATDRNNTMDSLLILTLLLAAWAFLKATETTRLRWLLLGALLVGLGFNIKTLAAFLPLPAFYALYFLGANEGLWRKLGKLARAGLLLLSVALSWITIVDLVPADQRPYVGSSGDNSEWSLAIGYNGINRLVGGLRRPGTEVAIRGGMAPGTSGPLDPSGAPVRPSGGQTQPGVRLPPRRDGQNPGQPGMPPRAGGGVFAIGQAGPQRLLAPPLSKEMSWLLPFGLMGAGLLLCLERLSWRPGPRHRQMVLWGGWLLTGAGFFSVAGFFHEYYLSILGPPLAVLVAAGAALLWDLRARRPWLAAGLFLGGAGLTLAFQVLTAGAFNPRFPWTVPALLLFGLGGSALISGNLRRLVTVSAAGWILVLAGMLVIPGAWSFLTADVAGRNPSLPSAYDGGGAGALERDDSSLTGLNINARLLAYLQEHTQWQKYLVAVPSSMQGADYVLATGRPVLYLGGFNGTDEVLTVEGLAELVERGNLRYLYIGGDGVTGGPGGVGSRAEINQWAAANCRMIPEFESHSRIVGAPDGATGSGFNLQLYDCGDQGS